MLPGHNERGHSSSEAETVEGCRRMSKDVEGQSPVSANRADRVALHFGGRPSKVRANDYSDKTLRACALWRECEVWKQCL